MIDVRAVFIVVVVAAAAAAAVEKSASAQVNPWVCNHCGGRVCCRDGSKRTRWTLAAAIRAAIRAVAVDQLAGRAWHVTSGRCGHGLGAAAADAHRRRAGSRKGSVSRVKGLVRIYRGREENRHQCEGALEAVTGAIHEDAATRAVK